MKIGIYFFSILYIVTFTSFTNPSKEKSENKKVKNIILFIGDGMGISQLYAGYTASKGNLNILKCKYIGLQKTNSQDNYVTDSAASGTAISSGKKTKNKMIGMGPDSTRLKSILEIAEENDFSTGLVSTSSITHATPASFIAHQPSRNMLEEIAYDFLATDIDVFIGGGSKYFSERSDSLNLIDSLKNKGYVIKHSIEDIKQVKSGKLAGFTAEGHNPPAMERGNMLSEATRVAIDILKNNENGFFLMVEGSQIDWGGHQNNKDYIINEVIDFDKAIGIGMEFANNNNETLVIITADHETGGMALHDGNIETGVLEAAFTSKLHSGVCVPVFAFGLGAENFIGFYDNTDIFYKMMKAYHFHTYGIVSDNN